MFDALVPRLVVSDGSAYEDGGLISGTQDNPLTQFLKMLLPW